MSTAPTLTYTSPFPGEARRVSPLDDPARRWPQYEEDEIAAVASVLQSGRVNSLMHGDQSRAFEEEFARFCGVRHGIAVANGTLALELALRAFGVGPGYEVIVPACSFFATAACVVAVGATPVFADIEANGLTIDPASVERMVSQRSRAILCVHLGGRPCNMTALRDVADRHGLWLIEDCAQAHGGTFDSRPLGSFGDAAAFSFCTDKIMSTGGEGGMLLLNDDTHWARAWAYKDHGKNPEKVLKPTSGNGFRYVHDTFGTNWRLTEMQAAIGRLQLKKLPRWLEQRRRNAGVLTELLSQEERLVLFDTPPGAESACYRFYCALSPSALSDRLTQNAVLAGLVARGIPAGSGSCPDMSQEAAFGAPPPKRDGALAVANEIGRRTIAFPVDHLLDEDDMRRMAAALRETLNELSETSPESLS
ncbi:DegT/DnrJ/EryC1/StrS family aminotransferase [Novosphingobium sp. M1R2S20]|uniref:DegT/DnrJ/EryC1/StrS family aminotransferase n=1 Tax=Novosphingobium rhizovicinum TaxID=3228928 RepID=A0ABV3RG14_9SPHN